MYAATGPQIKINRSRLSGGENYWSGNSFAGAFDFSVLKLEKITWSVTKSENSVVLTRAQMGSDFRTENSTVVFIIGEIIWSGIKSENVRCADCKSVRFRLIDGD